MNIKIISSTDRPKSTSLAVSNYVKKLFMKWDIVAEVISLADFPLPDVKGGNTGKKLKVSRNFESPS